MLVPTDLCYRRRAEIILTIAIDPRAVANYVGCTCLCCNWHDYNNTSGFRKI